MTDISKRYQQSKTGSPKELDKRVLAAARDQAGRNRELNRKPVAITWLPGAAFACVCLVSVTFIFNTDTSQLTEDVEFDAESSPLTFYDRLNDSNFALEEVVITAPKQERSLQDTSILVANESMAMAPKVIGESLEQRSESKMKQESIAKFEVTYADEDVSPEITMSSTKPRLKTQRSIVQEEAVSNNFISAKPDLINLVEWIPNILFDIRYFGSNNFVGEPIDGYFAEKALMTEEAGVSLAQVQKAANKQGLTLKIFDAYRPQQAVDHFVRWAEDLDDQNTKQIYYPNVEKDQLFAEGFIAKRSGHSRGSTVDLTLVDMASGQELDMGSPFDFFDPVSWSSSTEVSKQAQKNRQLLRTLMLDNGFKPYEAEWWHFTLKDEPFPNQYFDVPVE